MAKRGGARKAQKSARRGGIVPRAVFAAAVSIGSVPSLAACGGSSQQGYSVAVPPGVAVSTGGDNAAVDAGMPQPGVAAVDDRREYMTVAARPDDVPEGVAAVYRGPPPGVAARPYGVAVAPRKR